MKCTQKVKFTLLILSVMCGVLMAQNTTTLPNAPSTVQATQTQPSAFPETTVSFGLSPITLPGAKTSVAGAETDVFIKITPNFAIGETTLVSADYTFVGGRGNYVIPQFSTWLNNHSPGLNGYQFQLGITGSLGVSRGQLGPNGISHWGERAGMFLNYSFNGTTGLGIESQWCNFPGYAHSTYSIAFGPNFHF
jgi:hypothetical protein